MFSRSVLVCLLCLIACPVMAGGNGNGNNALFPRLAARRANAQAQNFQAQANLHAARNTQFIVVKPRFVQQPTYFVQQAPAPTYFVQQAPALAPAPCHAASVSPCAAASVSPCAAAALPQLSYSSSFQFQRSTGGSCYTGF